MKDQFEEYLRDRVCAGGLDLSRARQDLALNWIDAYQLYFHADPPLSGSWQVAIEGRNGTALLCGAHGAGSSERQTPNSHFDSFRGWLLSACDTCRWIPRWRCVTFRLPDDVFEVAWEIPSEQFVPRDRDCGGRAVMAVAPAVSSTSLRRVNVIVRIAHFRLLTETAGLGW